MNSSTALWTAAAALAGLYIYYEATRERENNPGIHDAGDSSVVFDPEQADEQAQQVQVPPAQDHRSPIEQDGEQQAGEQRPPANNNIGGPAGQAAQPPADNRDVGLEFDQDERARQALEARQQEQGNAPNRVNAWKQKGTVGTKKAKSLARRDQRRAYYEYVRQEADHQREQLQIEEQMFGDLIAEEREERRARIAEAKAELEEANRARRAREEEERRNRQQRRAEIETQVREDGIARLNNDDDIEIADDISSAVVLESGDYVVAVTPALTQELSNVLQKNGKVSITDVQQELLGKVYK